MSWPDQKVRRTDPAIAAQVAAGWPVVTVKANGPDWPVIAHRPVLMPKPGHGQAGRSRPSGAGIPRTIGACFVVMVPGGAPGRLRIAAGWPRLGPVGR